VQFSRKPLTAKPMTTRLSLTRAYRSVAGLIGAIVMLTGTIQLYAQGRRATTYPSAASTSENLQVTINVQPSIQLAARTVEVGEHVAGGNEEATVRIPILMDGANSAQGSTAETFSLATVSRVASLPNSNGYTLEATWEGSQECVVNIDGVPVALAGKTDITQAKAMGDPYGTETEHIVRIIHPSTPSGCQGSVLVLTARPKMR